MSRANTIPKLSTLTVTLISSVCRTKTKLVIYQSSDSYPCKSTESLQKTTRLCQCFSQCQATRWKRSYQKSNILYRTVCQVTSYNPHLHNIIIDVLRESGSLWRGSDFPKWKSIGIVDAEMVSRPTVVKPSLTRSVIRISNMF